MPQTQSRRDRRTDHDAETESHDFAASRERYRQLLATVEKNTGGPGTAQRAGLRECGVALHLVAHGPHTHAAVEHLLERALEADDLLAYRDEDGRRRYARRTIEGVRMIVAEQNMRERPDVDLQKRCAAILRGLADAE